jgi:hypothetical protein
MSESKPTPRWKYSEKYKNGRIVLINRKMIASSRDLSEEQCKEIPMTASQSEVFLAIDEFWKKYSYAPSLEDIAHMRGRAGKGNTKRIVDRLVALGVVKYLAFGKRTVRPVYLKFRNLQ